MDVTSIHLHPGVIRVRTRHRSVPFSRGNFGCLVPSCQGHKQQLLGLFCSPCKVTPPVCVCPWRSVCLSWSCGGGGHRVASMSVVVLFIFLRVICHGMLWGCISRSQGFMCLWMRGSPHSPEFQGASPLFFGGRFGSCSTSSLCFSPLPLAKLKCCVGAQAG